MRDMLREEEPRPSDPALTSMCTTTEAARRLGVSATTVQSMVERGELDAWKTRGGHRRISQESIQRLLAAQAGRNPDAAAPGLTLLVVEDDAVTLAVYESQIASWQLPLRLLTATDGVSGLLLIERNRPDVLITDLVMQPMDGLALLQLLRQRPEFAAMSIAAVTSLDDAQIARRGGLPPGTALYRKPILFDRLHGFVEALVLRKLAESR